jgi:uncharacterized membrane protein
MRYGRGFIGPEHLYGSMHYWPYSWIFMIGIALLVLVIGFYMVKRHAGKKQSSDALTQLKARYVAGEIDDETYQRMKSVIGN